MIDFDHFGKADADLHVWHGRGIEMIDFAHFGKADADNLCMHSRNYTVRFEQDIRQYSASHGWIKILAKIGHVEMICWNRTKRWSGGFMTRW